MPNDSNRKPQPASPLNPHSSTDQLPRCNHSTSHCTPRPPAPPCRRSKTPPTLLSPQQQQQGHGQPRYPRLRPRPRWPDKVRIPLPPLNSRRRPLPRARRLPTTHLSRNNPQSAPEQTTAPTQRHFRNPAPRPTRPPPKLPRPIFPLRKHPRQPPQSPRGKIPDNRLQSLIPLAALAQGGAQKSLSVASSNASASPPNPPTTSGSAFANLTPNPNSAKPPKNSSRNSNAAAAPPPSAPLSPSPPWSHSHSDDSKSPQKTRCRRFQPASPAPSTKPPKT